MPHLTIRVGDALLAKLDEQDNRSAFVRQAVRDSMRRAEWAREALSGWTDNEVRACLSAIDASQIDLSAPLGPQLADALREEDSKATAWGIEPSRWYELIRQLHSTPTTARALFDLHTTTHE